MACVISSPHSPLHCEKNLLAAGVLEENITVQTVPGSYELPLAVQR
jgi:6,7-dimethyl-8-ribityllumazine synthase